MTLKEYYNHIKIAAEAAGGSKIIDAIWNAPNQGWLDGYQEIKDLQERLLSFVALDDMSQEALDYYLGDKVATLEDIKANRIEKVKSKFPDPEQLKEWGNTIEEWSKDQRDSGYMDYQGLQYILNQWENMTESDLWDLIRGYYDEDSEYLMDGHRDYLMGGEVFNAMLYSFWHYDKKILDELDGDVYNSNEVEELLISIKPQDVSDITSETLKKAADTSIRMSKEKIRNNFNRDIDELVRRYKDEPGLQELLEEIEQKKIPEET